MAGKKLYIHNDSKIVRFKDYNKDGVIGHNKDTPYKGVTKGQVLSFREPHDALYTAFFTKEGDFRGYFKKDYSGEETEWHHPEKWDNFDWQTNNNRMKTAMYTDGGHYMGNEDYEPTYASQEVMAEKDVKLVYHFTTAESIEKWNEAVRQSGSNMNRMLGIITALITRKAGTAGSIASGVGASLFFEKVLAPQNINLDPGGKIVFGTRIQVIRSTGESSNDDRLNMNQKNGLNGLKMKYYSQYINGSDVKGTSRSGFYGVQPYTYSMHEDFLQLCVRNSQEDSRTYVENPDHGLMNFVLRRTK
ncbi:MAG: hypothetical protein ACJAUD_001130 [Crocinitomicaceae bacterium]